MKNKLKGVKMRDKWNRPYIIREDSEFYLCTGLPHLSGHSRIHVTQAVVLGMKIAQGNHEGIEVLKI